MINYVQIIIIASSDVERSIHCLGPSVPPLSFRGFSMLLCPSISVLREDVISNNISFPIPSHVFKCILIPPSTRVGLHHPLNIFTPRSWSMGIIVYVQFSVLTSILQSAICCYSIYSCHGWVCAIKFLTSWQESHPRNNWRTNELRIRTNDPVVIFWECKVQISRSPSNLQGEHEKRYQKVMTGLWEGRVF